MEVSILLSNQVSQYWNNKVCRTSLGSSTVSFAQDSSNTLMPDFNACDCAQASLHTRDTSNMVTGTEAEDEHSCRMQNASIGLFDNMMERW